MRIVSKALFLLTISTGITNFVSGPVQSGDVAQAKRPTTNFPDFMESQELLGEMELLSSLERFFDRVSYFAAVGYEGARARQVVHALAEHQGH